MKPGEAGMYTKSLSGWPWFYMMVSGSTRSSCQADLKVVQHLFGWFLDGFWMFFGYLVGGLELFFFHTLGIIAPTDFHITDFHIFQRG